MNTVDTRIDWEYTQDQCDIWQLHHMCNYFAVSGWDVVAVVESYPGAKVTRSVGPDDGQELVEALKAVVVLFRRPLKPAGEDDE